MTRYDAAMWSAFFNEMSKHAGAAAALGKTFGHAGLDFAGVGAKALARPALRPPLAANSMQTLAFMKNYPDARRTVDVAKSVVRRA